MLHEINLFPWRDWERAQYRQRFYFMLSAMLGLAALCQIAGGIWIETQQQQQTARVERLKQEQQELEPALQDFQHAQQALQVLSQRQNTLIALHTQRQQLIPLLNQLPTWIPVGVYLDTLTISAQQIHWVGMSESAQNVTQLLAQLENAALLHHIHLHSLLPDVARFSRSLAQFEISAQWQSSHEEQEQEQEQ